MLRNALAQAREAQAPTASLQRTASWVITEKAAGRVICETFNPDVVAALNTAKFKAVPILEHLQGLNKGPRP